MPFLLMDFSAPSREPSTTESLIMWVTVIFLFFVLPRLLLFLVDRRTSPKPETETTPAANAAPSIDDDWADIALQLKKENGND